MKTLLKVSSVAVAGMLLMGTSAFAKGEKYTLESMKVSSPISLFHINLLYRNILINVMGKNVDIDDCRVFMFKTSGCRNK